MNRSRRTLLVGTLALIAGAAAHAGGAGAAGTYTITFDRPLAVGQKFQVRAEGMLERSVGAFVNGRDRAQDSRLSVKLNAEAEVLKVDAGGQPARTAYHVTECVAKRDGVASVIAPPGATLIAWRQGQDTHFELDGRPISARDNEALQLIVDSPSSSGGRDAGSAHPRAIGESWPIDAHAGADAIQRGIGQRVSSGDLSGQTTFVDVTEHAGHRCLMLYTQITAPNAVPSVGNVPSGFRLTSGNVNATAHKLYPIDEQLPVLSEFQTFEVDAVYAGETSAAGAQADEMRVQVTRIVQIEKTPISGTGRAQAE